MVTAVGPAGWLPIPTAAPAKTADSAHAGSNPTSRDGTEPVSQRPRTPFPNDEVRLDEQELKKVEELARRDREVRSHELAHLAAAGPYAQGGIKLKYTQGPDGKRYAVGGEVGIDTSPVPGDPEATLEKARAIRAAAMAPVEPSAQDRRVAVEAARLMAQAQAELARQRNGQDEDTTGDTDKANTSPLDAYAREPAAPRLDLRA